MITDINKPIEAVEDKSFDFEVAPEGDYLLKVKECTDWTKETKASLAVITRDEHGKAVKDEKGKNVTETATNVDIYSAKLQFEIVGGEHEGKIVFHRISTHPNTPFQIPAFIWALGIEKLAPADIPSVAVGKFVYAAVKVEEYDKKTTDKDSGFEKTETRKSNKIGNFKELPDAVVDALSDMNSGAEETDLGFD